MAASSKAQGVEIAGAVASAGSAAAAVVAGLGVEAEVPQVKIEAEADGAAVEIARRELKPRPRGQSGADTPEGAASRPVAGYGDIGEQGQTVGPQRPQGEVADAFAGVEGWCQSRDEPQRDPRRGAQQRPQNEDTFRGSTQVAAARPSIGESDAGAAIATGGGEAVVVESPLALELSVNDAETEIRYGAEDSPVGGDVRHARLVGPGERGLHPVDVGEKGGVDVAVQTGGRAGGRGREEFRAGLVRDQRATSIH